MSRAVRISTKSARALLGYFANVEVRDRLLDPAVEELRAALSLRRPKAMGVERKRERAKKKATKKDRWAEIRAAVYARADGVCECGCGRRMTGTFMFEQTPDHFWGRAREESVESVWALATIHHENKGQNFPSRVAWLEKWIAHCTKHGYSRQIAKARRELDSEALVREAAAVGVGR